MILPLIVFALIFVIIIIWKNRSKLSQIYPKKTAAEKETIKSETVKKETKTSSWLSNLITLVIIGVIGYGIYLYFSSRPEHYAGKYASVPVREELPICAGDYDFSEIDLPEDVTVDFRQDCDCQVTLPPNAWVRTHRITTDIKIKFANGEEFIDGPGRQLSLGEHRRQMFKVHGLREAGTMNIFMEKKKRV